MLFSVFAVSCLMAVQAVPLGYEMESGRMGISRGILGSSFGAGRSLPDRTRSGSEYGRRGRVGSSNRYEDMGYEREGGFSSHDAGHSEHDYKQITESHVSEDHNSGHSEGFGSRGYKRGGHSYYGAEEDSYGGRYYSGHGI